MPIQAQQLNMQHYTHKTGSQAVQGCDVDVRLGACNGPLRRNIQNGGAKAPGARGGAGARDGKSLQRPQGLFHEQQM